MAKRTITSAAFKMGALLFITALPLACEPSPEIVYRPVVIHVPSACGGREMVSASSETFSLFQAGGDFDPGAITPSDSTPVSAVGAALVDLPAASKSISVDVTDNLSSEWTGLSLIGSQGPVDVLAWPTKSSCALSTDVERPDAMIGAFDDHHVLIVGGGAGLSQTPDSFVANMQTGRITPMPLGLGTSRVSATITAFGNGALVAGGSDPSTSSVIGTAEVYVHSEPVGDFDPVRIDLSTPRTNHGAVVLANGGTLLVGGLDSAGRALSSMEIIDSSRRSSTHNVAKLEVARVNPTVMRLASGEILVAGGFTPGVATSITPNPAPIPVPWLEWFKPDASEKSKNKANLVACTHRAFVPLDAGGALAVIAPDDQCTNDVQGFSTTWLITGDGTLENAPIAIPGITGNNIALFRGVNGSPMLFTGSSWFAYAPWNGVFKSVSDAPTDGPLGATTTADNGLGLWLASDGSAVHLVGYRFGTAHAYESVPPDLLTTGTDHFAPDRAPSSDSLGWDPGDGLPGDGLLDLPVTATAMLTDATFAGFSLDFVSRSFETPWVVLRDDAGNEVDIGEGSLDCNLLVGERIHVERHGAIVSFSEDGSVLAPCPATVDPNARLHVGLSGSPAVSTDSFARDFTIVRSDD